MAMELVAADGTVEEEMGRARAALNSTAKDTVRAEIASTSREYFTT